MMSRDLCAHATLESFGDRESWAAARCGRGSGIGASESPSVLGISPWSSATDVWLRKTGRINGDRATIPMRVGTALEGLILDLYKEETGGDVAPFDQSSWLRSRTWDWMTCTPDAVGADGTLVEAKSVELRSREQAEQWGREGTDEVPYHYLVQVHHQMAVTGATRVDVAVLIGKSEFRYYRVPRNDDLVAKIVGATGIFWRDCVLADRPPEDEYVPAVKLLKIYPGCEGAVDLGDDAVVALRALDRIGVACKANDLEKERLKAIVYHALGNAQFGRLPDGMLVKRIVERIPERQQTVRAHERQRFVVIRGA